MATLRVKADYPTIQAAVDAASPGDIIAVESGVYNEQVTIAKNYIRLVGDCDSVLDGKLQLTTAFILNNTIGVSITSFKIKNYKADGIDINNGSNNVIAKNTITNNGYYGISTYNTIDTQIIRNIISSNYYGIYDYARNTRIEGNILTFNGYVGMYINFSEANTEITKNIVIKNYSYGIICYGNNCQITKNKISGHMSYGVLIYYSTLLKENKISKNNSDGVYVYYQNNTVVENEVCHNGQNGIDVSSSANYSSILDNHVTGNKLNGILVYSQSNIVSGNTSRGNQFYDIVRVRANNYFSDNKCEKSLPPCICSFGEGTENIQLEEAE